MLTLHKLEIELHSYGEFKGQYTGKVTYGDGERYAEKSILMLNLDPSISNALLKACSEAIQEASMAASKQFSTIVDHSLACASKPKEIGQ